MKVLYCEFLGDGRENCPEELSDREIEVDSLPCVYDTFPAERNVFNGAAEVEYNEYIGAIPVCVALGFTALCVAALAALIVLASYRNYPLKAVVHIPYFVGFVFVCGCVSMVSGLLLYLKANDDSHIFCHKITSKLRPSLTCTSFYQCNGLELTKENEPITRYAEVLAIFSTITAFATLLLVCLIGISLRAQCDKCRPLNENKKRVHPSTDSPGHASVVVHVTSTLEKTDKLGTHD